MSADGINARLPEPATAPFSSSPQSRSRSTSRLQLPHHHFERHTEGLQQRLFTGWRRRRTILVLLLFLVAVLLFAHRDDAITVHLRDAGYATRPLWDRPPPRFKRVLHLSDDNTLWSGVERETPASQSAWEPICTAHGLGTASAADIPKVYDAVIFSVELDLLEIRMRELHDVVDHFVVVESNVTFSGDTKPLTFEDNIFQFGFARDKLVYRQVLELHSNTPNPATIEEKLPRDDPFTNENRMRAGVSRILESLQPPPGSIILQSDVDEIPSERAVSLLKHCTGWNDVIHLGLPSYLYSFEFPMDRSPPSMQRQDRNNGEGAGTRQCRASAKRYGTKNYKGYTHSRQSDTILEMAGWHVTFGFKYIDDFIFKMKSYSHNDRVTSATQLSPAEIQHKVCTGADIFDMLPEAYDYSSLWEQLGPIPPTSETSHIPKSVLENKAKFGYLLPEGCQREMSPPKQ